MYFLDPFLLLVFNQLSDIVIYNDFVKLDNFPAKGTSRLVPLYLLKTMLADSVVT